MALTELDKIEIRGMYLKDLKDIFGTGGDNLRTEGRVVELIWKNEDDLKKSQEAAEVNRRLVPEDKP